MSSFLIITLIIFIAGVGTFYSIKSYTSETKPKPPVNKTVSGKTIVGDKKPTSRIKSSQAKKTTASKSKKTVKK